MLKQEKEVYKSLQELMACIKASHTYQEYITQATEVNKDPQLRSQIDQFRLDNFALHQNYQGEELERKMGEMEKRAEQFRQNPLVDNFLAAELGFCRLLQEIEDTMEQEMNFQ